MCVAVTKATELSGRGPSEGKRSFPTAVSVPRISVSWLKGGVVELLVGSSVVLSSVAIGRELGAGDGEGVGCDVAVDVGTGEGEVATAVGVGVGVAVASHASSEINRNAHTTSKHFMV